MDVAFNNHSICHDSPGAPEDIEMGITCRQSNCEY